MFTWIDSLLLNVAQKFCDKFQRLTGLTKFKLEKWSSIIAATCYWMFAIYSPVPFLIVVAVACSAWSFLAIRKIERREELFLARGKVLYSREFVPQFRIATLVSQGIFVILTLPLLPFAPEMVWFLGWILCILAGTYFTACVPRPPSKSKVCEWLEQGLLWLRDKLPPVPTPIPNQ